MTFGILVVILLRKINETSMTNFNFNTQLDRFEKEKLCNLLECSLKDLDLLIDDAEKIYHETNTVYDSIMKILQQGYNVREATLISLICGKYYGFNQAEEQIEEDIKQKLFDAFNKRRG